MAVGIPSVASPVGMNKDVIKNNINGFLASDEEQWYENLSLLIADRNMRIEMGANARRIAEKYYSLDITAPKITELIKGFRRNR